VELIGWGQKLLEVMTEVLDGERGVLSNEKNATPKNPFYLLSDIDSLSKEVTGPHKYTDLFNRLAPFFHAGFLLKRQSQWLFTDIFLLGQKYKPDQGKSNVVPFAVPNLRLFQVLRGRGPALLKSFKLEELGSFRESSVFLVRVSDDIAYVLLCDRPEPWRSLNIEAFFSVLLKILKPESPQP
jgi:hypothetical protein